MEPSSPEPLHTHHIGAYWLEKAAEDLASARDNFTAGRLWICRKGCLFCVFSCLFFSASAEPKVL